LEKTLERVELLLKRAELRIQGLERTVSKLEDERDQLQDNYERVLSENWDLKKRVGELEDKLEDANKQLAWFRKDKFGRHNESDIVPTPADETETPPSDGKEPTKRKRGQQRGAKGHGRTDRGSLPTDEQTIEIPNCACPTCARPFRRLPETDDSTMADINVFLFLTLFHRCRYVPQCNCPEAKMQTAPAPPRLYNRTTIGNSLWVYLIVWKFLQGVPVNRVLKDLSLQGLPVAAGTVTGGFRIIDTLVQPLYDEIVEYCQGEQYWNGDETTWRVFQDNNGKASNKKWWLWLIAGEKAIVYLLDESRSGSVPREFLAGSCGTMTTDRYSAYKTLADSIKKAWCWVHVRRDFVKVFDGVPKYRTWARDWLVRISKLFVLQHHRFRLWRAHKTIGPEWTEAISALNEHVQLLEDQWRQELDQFPEKTKRTVLQSLKRHWPGLTLFLSDPRIPLDNNRAERLLRFCVISRKNSYGSGAEWAGHFSAKMFSIFQTWLVNGLDPYALLRDYFDRCSQTPGRPPPNVDDFLPWKMSEERCKQFCLRPSYVRPG